MESYHRIVDYLTLEPGASRALDAAFAVQEDQFSKGDILLAAELIIKVESAGIFAMPYC